MATKLAASGCLVPVDSSGRRKIGPVYIGAALGFIYLVFMVYLYANWVMDPRFGITPIGPDIPPLRVIIAVRLAEAASFAVLCWTVYYFVFRDWRRTGSISENGLCVFAALTMYFHDPFENYACYFFLYNSIFVNAGSWVMHVPGWQTPRGNLVPEALICWGGAYSWWVVLPGMLGGAIMRRARQSFTRISNLEMFASFIVIFFICDLLLEIPITRMSLYNFGTTIPALTLFAGKPWQFPLYEASCNAVYWTMMAACFYYRDEKNFMFIEHGMENVVGHEKLKKVMRFLAIVFVFHTINLVCYHFPMQAFSKHGAAFPKGLPSYVLSGVCGEGTPYACPGPDVALCRGENSKQLSPLLENRIGGNK